MKTRTVLVAIDASPRAPAVLAAGIENARQAGGKVLLLRAVGLPLELPPEAMSASPECLPDLLRARAMRDLEARATSIPAELFGEIRAVVGVPWEAICRTAQEVNADVIVIGSHGYSGLDRLLGTTASRVVNHADRSVLVVREPHA